MPGLRVGYGALRSLQFAGAVRIGEGEPLTDAPSGAAAHPQLTTLRSSGIAALAPMVARGRGSRGSRAPDASQRPAYSAHPER